MAHRSKAAAHRGQTPWPRVPRINRTQPENRDDRTLSRLQGAGLLPPEAQGALRHRGIAVRRARRSDQHHAAHPAKHGRRGGPPGAQPIGRRGRHRGVAGRRAGHRGQQLPGRARRVLQVHDRAAARARGREHPGVRRRWRRDRAGRDPRAGRRRRAHLQPRRRAAHGPERDDRRDGDALRRRPGAAGRRRCEGDPRTQRSGVARAGAADHGARERRGVEGDARRVEAGRGSVESTRGRHHRHGWRGQVVVERRAGAPAAARPGRQAARRDHLDRSVAAQEWWRAAGGPHPHECDLAVGIRTARLHAQPRHPRHRQRSLRRACPTSSSRARPRASTS